eukprot:7884119-Pyramimonas_sp.AAC.1
MDPPTTTTPSSRATSVWRHTGARKGNALESIKADGDSPMSISSAYSGKLLLEYGQFHISGSTT